MNLQEHEQKDGFKIWLSEQEVNSLLDQAIHPRASIAFALGAKCGLRSHEIVELHPEDIVETDIGPMLRVEHGKGDKFRETPIPPELKTTIETAVEFREEGLNEPVILNTKGEPTTTRTLRNWLDQTRKQLADREDEKYWLEVNLHDLRRTWATALASKSVDPLICCDWGGWSNLETFLDHYRGTYSPEAQARERNKVEWL